MGCLAASLASTHSKFPEIELLCQRLYTSVHMYTHTHTKLLIYSVCFFLRLWIAKLPYKKSVSFPTFTS